MFTYLIYNMILVLSFLSAYLAEFSKTKFQRIVCRIVLFNILFIPAAIRYNVELIILTMWIILILFMGMM